MSDKCPCQGLVSIFQDLLAADLTSQVETNERHVAVDEYGAIRQRLHSL